MRDSKFGEREPSTMGSVVHDDVELGEKTNYESIGQPATGSDAKHLAASHAIQERVRRRRVNAAHGYNEGRPDYKASHSKNPYKPSGDEPKGPAHATGTKQL